MRNDLRAGSGPASAAIGAAEAYHNGVLKQQALMNSMFDKFASFVKEQRAEKREDKADLQKEQIHALQKDSLQKQNELLGKNLAHFEKDKAEERARNKAQNAAAYASAGVNNEQQKALKMQRKEKEDFDKLSKRLNPLNYQQNSLSNIDDTDIQNALSFSENALLPQRR
ncbi:hypothetical protein HRN94_000074 [Campylobacter upsaliensis]|nr:hypothetical protein [Campylobacter upsaliensis]